MNKILFDYTYYQSGSRFHGGGEYGDVILNALISTDFDEDHRPGLFYRQDRRVNRVLLDRAQNAGWNLHPIREGRNLPKIIEKYGYNTIYSPLPYIFNWGVSREWGEVRFVGTFHGLRLVELLFYLELEQNKDVPENKSLSECKMYYQRALHAFDNTDIVVVSTHSKYSLLHYFPEIDQKKVHVFYSPLKQVDVAIDTSKEQEFLQNCGVKCYEYGLMVSANYWYKNVKRGIKAYDLVFSGNHIFVPKDYKVIILGGKNNEEELLEGVINRNRFIFLDYIENDELEILYKNAQLFLYPSLNEGFGYPPLEAMKYGTLCACSANTSISEVCQDMVWYFNPLDIDEIAIRILTSFSDEEREKKSVMIEEKLPKLFERQKDDLKKLVDLIVQREGV